MTESYNRQKAEEAVDRVGRLELRVRRLEELVAALERRGDSAPGDTE